MLPGVGRGSVKKKALEPTLSKALCREDGTEAPPKNKDKNRTGKDPERWGSGGPRIGGGGEEKRAFLQPCLVRQRPLGSE